MSTTIAKLEIYTVVEVWRGMTQKVRNFRRLGNAQKYMKRARRHYNPIADEVALFKTSLRVSR